MSELLTVNNGWSNGINVWQEHNPDGSPFPQVEFDWYGWFSVKGVLFKFKYWLVGNSWSSYLMSHKPGPEYQIFTIDRTSQGIVATTIGVNVAAGAVPWCCLLLAGQGQADPLVDASWSALQTTSNFVNHSITMNYGGQPWFVRVTDMTVGPMTWHIVCVVPTSVVVGPLTTATTISFSIMSAVVVVGAIIAVLLSLGVSGPLVKLCDEMVLASELDLDAVDTEREASSLTEIAAMQKAFLKMVQNMKEYRNYMPASILADNKDEEEEEEVDDVPVNSVRPTPVEHSLAGGGGSRRGSRISKAQEVGDGRSIRSTSTTESHGAQRSKYVVSMDMKRKRITVAVFGVRDWETQCEALKDDGKLSSAHGAYVKTLLDNVGHCKGTPDVFLGDQFIATWNTIRPAGTHRILAVEAALAALRLVSDSCGWQCAVGVSSGESRCGNMGCVGMKKYTYIGAPSKLAFFLERRARLYSAGVVVDQTVEEDAGNTFYVRKIEHVLIPQLHKGPSGIKPHRIYQVTGSKTLNEDEWMYQLEGQKGKKDPGESFTAAVDLFYANHTQATAARDTLLSTCNASDPVVARWLGILKVHESSTVPPALDEVVV